MINFSVKYSFMIITCLIAVTSMIVLIYGLTTWNDKTIGKCLITKYQIGDLDCSVQYYTPASLGCKEPMDVFPDIGVCNMLDLYAYDNTQIVLPCLISSHFDLKSCPSFEASLDYPQPYFNYLSSYTEAHLCVIVGGVMFASVFFVALIYLICQLYAHKKELNSINSRVNDYESIKK